MRYNKRWKFVAPIIIGLQLSACQQKPEMPANMTNLSPARVEHAGPGMYRVRLTAKRAAELGIKTAPVREEKTSGILHKVIPATAVTHDQQGNTWAFKRSDSLVFVRERISVAALDGDLAILSDGPPVGTAVVISGAAALFNDEFNTSGEEIGESKTAEVKAEKKSSGTATMQEDGSLKVVHNAVGATGLTASIVIVYKPADEEYQQIIAQVGGLKVGETKSLPPPVGK